jgi:uncharacterized protein YjgD (DUF1641 family)
MKKETLEERINYISTLHLQNLNGRETDDVIFEAGIEAGIKETEEIMYSEEEVLNLLTAFIQKYGTKYTVNINMIYEWFEQFKKK